MFLDKLEKPNKDYNPRYNTYALLIKPQNQARQIHMFLLLVGLWFLYKDTESCV